MKKQINLQDTFLNEVRKEKIKVTIFLINGVRLAGLVEGFDNFTVILSADGKQEMIYKHAISTIVPEKEVKSLFKDE
ncbi:RNA chaperone Hfq [Orenia metallireducens]|jgi:host factor-I protein|uniref:RNA-binding protein Hfq n=1 Tax=Orenia metallireducens TaxID=1413210 RepID=A0A1C0A7L4_9FIRM|nr:RNA chaperone Hfq [Orenia metallireducens]